MTKAEAIARGCDESCYSMPTCTVCHRRKAPRGRSVPLVAASAYCSTHNCAGYDAEPRPGHEWPEESPFREEEDEG